MPTPGSPTTRTYSLSELPQLGGVRGERVVLDFSPKPTSTERMVAGVVTKLDSGEVSYTCAIDEGKAQHAFGDAGLAFHAIALQLCASMTAFWQTHANANDWSAPFAGAGIADQSNFSGRSAKLAQSLMLNRSSTLHTLLENYDFARKASTAGIVERVRSAISKDPNSKHLSKRFGRVLPLGDQTLPLRVDFLGQNYACYFLQVSKSTRAHEQNTDKAFGKLYELQALRRLLQQPQDAWELLEDERPKNFELVMVADRNNMEQRQAVYKVERLADKGEIIAKTVASANDAAAHVAQRERQAA
jgi:hypothetical protein